MSVDQRARQRERTAGPNSPEVMADRMRRGLCPKCGVRGANEGFTPVMPVCCCSRCYVSEPGLHCVDCPHRGLYK